MDQTSQAAAVAVVIAAPGEVIGMLTVFALASRTSAGTRGRPALVTSAAAQVPDVVVMENAVEQPLTAFGTAIVKQRGIPTSV